MKNNFRIWFVTAYIITFNINLAQVNFEPLSSSVYTYLERNSIKGLIQLNEEIKPFSRMYIAGKLQAIAGKLDGRIQNLELEELQFYIKDYAVELKKLGFDVSVYKVKDKLIDLDSENFGFDKFGRFRLFSYDSESFNLFADPILKYEHHSNEDGAWWSYSNGIKIYGALGGNVGFDLQFYDNHPRGEGFDINNYFNDETGYEFRVGNGNGFDYDRMNANLNFSGKSASVSISKDFNYYGSGEDGKLILSNKAPSFPNLKLEVYPADWLKFSYILGYLHSKVLDSATFRYNPYRNHISNVEKYFVTHMLSLTPFRCFNLSVGESIIYSDRFEPIYLVPFSFFRFSDHYLTSPDESAGNAQLFSSFWYKNNWLKTKIYGSIFIDELTTYENDFPEALGYNLGLKAIDPLIPQSEIIVEYSRINPFVYFHSDKAQTFASYGYEMGHWIGSNADEIFIAYRKRILRGLNFDLKYRYIRKGSEEDFNEPRYLKYQKFLWGNITKYNYYQAELNYELIHSFNFNLSYLYIKAESRTYSNSNGNINLSVGYGI